MSSEKPWPLRAIGDVCKVVGGGTPSTKLEENFDGGIPWITPKDLSGFNLRRIKRGQRDLSSAGLNRSSARMVPRDTVLLTTRAPIGYVAIADQEVSTNQGFRSLVLNDGEDPDFYYYLLKNSKPVLEANANGSTFKELSGSVLKKLEFAIPPVGVQRQIARILGALDDKIESNRRLAKTLEEIVATLFKARFVDFLGQDDLVKNEFGSIPKGWDAKPVAELAEYVNGKAFTKHASGSGKIVIRIAELKSGPGKSTVYSDYEADDKFKAFPGDILFAWSGSLDVYRWYREEALINQHIFKVIPKGYPAWFVFCALKSVMPQFQGIAADKATTMGHIKRGDLDKHFVAAPPSDVIDAASREFEPLFDRSLAARRESETLAEIRDALLPRLISGELRVPEGAFDVEVST